MSDWIFYACVLAVIAGGLVAGIFMAFSDFIMKALLAASPRSGIEAMQEINRKVYGSLFLILLMGMAALSLALAVSAMIFGAGPASFWVLGGAGLYGIGTFLVTVIFNVPMNQKLDRMDPAAPETASYWSVYTARWTAWNHVRSLASAGSAVCYLISSLLLI